MDACFEDFCIFSAVSLFLFFLLAFHGPILYAQCGVCPQPRALDRFI
jgi:hypothetical protein